MKRISIGATSFCGIRDRLAGLTRKDVGLGREIAMDARWQFHGELDRLVVDNCAEL